MLNYHLHFFIFKNIFIGIISLLHFFKVNLNISKLIPSLFKSSLNPFPNYFIPIQ